MSNTTIWIIVVLIILAVLAWYFYPHTAKSPGIDVERIATEVANGEALLLDVRRDDELEDSGYALGSTHFELARLETGELPDASHETKIYTYCQSGGRAGTAERILEDAGFQSVESIGGLSDWEAAGGNVVR